MQKWEYCLLFFHPVYGIYILSQDDRQTRYPIKEYSWTSILNKLGDSGWEAVNYVSGIGDFGKSPTKALTSDQLKGWPVVHEILFKRATE